MKIECRRNNLVDAIGYVQKFTAKSTTLPILEGILIEARVTDGVKLTGYDLETGIECRLDADVPFDGEGSVVVSGRMFGDIIRKLPDDLVSISTDKNNTLKVECGSTHFTIKGMSAEDYPKLPEVDSSGKLLMKQHLLKEMVRQTLFAVSTDDSRPTFTGVLLNCKDKVLEMVTLDGHRMAVRRHTFEVEVPDFRYLVPGKAIAEIGRLMASIAEADVEVYASNNQIVFDTGKNKVTSRLLKDEYPDYSKLLPRQHSAKVTVGVEGLRSAVDRAGLVAGQEDKKTPVHFKISGDVLGISAKSQMGEHNEEIAVQCDGDKCELAFNPKYVIDALKAIDEDEVYISFNGNMGPTLVSPLDDPYFEFLLLPIRTQ